MLPHALAVTKASTDNEHLSPSTDHYFDANWCDFMNCNFESMRCDPLKLVLLEFSVIDPSPLVLSLVLCKEHQSSFNLAFSNHEV